MECEQLRVKVRNDGEYALCCGHVTTPLRIQVLSPHKMRELREEIAQEVGDTFRQVPVTVHLTRSCEVMCAVLSVDHRN